VKRGWHTVATFSRGVARLPHLTSLLDAREVVLHPDDAAARRIDAVIGWGEKANTAAAVAYAEKHRLPYWRAEDGFVRSVGLGVAGEPPLSIVLDDLGIYYDARRPSRLERMLEEGDELRDAALLARARRAIDRIVAAKLSKYNDAPPDPIDLPRRPRVLVVDQTRGDLSIECGLADASSFQRMFDAALSENPDAEVLVKVHPDVLAGKKAGYLERAAGERVRLWAQPASPLALLEHVDKVYVVTSQVGFEALLAGKPVVCFGTPFYAGWGLTEDRAAIPRRTARRTLEQVFAAAYLLYPRYRDPATGAACELERVLDHLELQRRMFAENRGTIVCFGFQLWKRNYVRAYLRCPGNRIVFHYTAAGAARRGLDGGERILVWGRRDSARVRALAAKHGVPIWRMEDGFLRSVGLGAELVTPASLVVDREGIYFDPTQPSELESILERGGFTGDELARAAALRRAIVDRGLSKYNVGADRRLTVPAGRRVLLVPGQVESDQSVRVGCPEVKTNVGLLEAVRRAAPDAFVIYKPHPDVVSGNRAGRRQRAAALALCDHLEEHATVAQCLEVADEVHVLTSLVGFEALLRGKRVVVHGQPFYAGWGLTEDRHAVARRTRRITLDELVAGALIRYPRYLDRATGRFTTPEAIIDELVAERAGDAAARVARVSWPRRTLRKLVRAYRGVVHAP
jgi:capsular polysaccharide export protein